MEILTASVGFCLGITRAYREMNKRALAEAPFAVAHANAGSEFDTLSRIERREPALLAQYPGLRELSVVRDVSTLGAGDRLILGFHGFGHGDLKKPITNIASECRSANIVRDHAMILPDDATPKPDGIFGKDRRKRTA